MNLQKQKTMKFNSIYRLAATFITAALVLGSLSACSNENLVTDTQNTTQAKTYTVRIPATMGSDTRAVTFDNSTTPPTAVSSFTTTDKIYVYNQTKEQMLTGYLTPTAAGKTCILTGSITGTIAAGDQLVLLYNLTYYSSDKSECFFYYDEQNGTQAGVVDGAKAMVIASVDGNDLSSATASFQNVQSMFRFQFKSGENAVSVKSVEITPYNNGIALCYFPLKASEQYADLYGLFGLYVKPTSPTSGPIYAALCINESVGGGATLTFEVVDADNKYYTTTKNVPAGGFVNGKYYYNAAPIDLGAYVLQLVKPTLSRSDGGDPSELAEAWSGRCFMIYSPSETTGITMSMSGTNTGYWYRLKGGSGNTINMSNLTATYDETTYFVDSYNSLTINISGANIIRCPNYDDCIFSDGDLKLSGNGTLTVTANDNDDCGLYANNYNPGVSTDPSDLAATGHTVTRSERTDNLDGTYTWTYTVTSKP